MTNDEITKQLESLLAHCKSMIEKDGGFPIWEKDCEALEAAIAALRPSGEPLTLEQLREMDGRPVWLKVAGGIWGIVDCFNGGVVTSLAEDISLNALAGLAYAYPPIDREKWEPCKACRICANCIYGGMSGEEIMKLCLECYDKPFSLWKPRYKFCQR